MMSEGNMNIDERLEALTRSVEGLKMTGDLLLASQAETERRMQALITLHMQNEERMEALGNYVHQIASIVLNHEDRIRDLEGNNGGAEDQPQA
jgi:hypothetical protein